MLTTDLLVEVRNSALDRQGVITPTDLKLDATIPFNDVGTWEVEIAASHPLAAVLAAPGGGLVVSDLSSGEVLFSGPATAPERSRSTENVGGTVVVQGVTDEIVLSDMLAWPDPTNGDITAQAQEFDVRTGSAESLLHAYVNANIGPGGAAGRRNNRLVMGQSLNRGAVVTKKARLDNLLLLCQEIAAPDRLGFRVVQSNGRLEFRTFIARDQQGSVRFTLDNDNLTSTRVATSAPGITHAIIAGDGGATTRLFRERTNTDALDASKLWGRRIEVMVDQQGTRNIDELDRAGDEALVTNNGFTGSDAQFEPTEAMRDRFITDWFLGDTVSVEAEGNEYFAPIGAFVVKADESGLRVGAQLGTPALSYAAALGRLEQTVQRIAANDGIVETVNTHDADLINLNTVVLPQLNAELDQAQADIAANAASIQPIQGDIDNLNNTVIPGLQSDLDAANADLATLEGKFPIQTVDITDNAISAPKIAADAVEADKIKAGAVTTDKMTANSINGDRIAANTLHADKIIANTITGDKIAANTIAASKLVITDLTNHAIDFNVDANRTALPPSWAWDYYVSGEIGSGYRIRMDSQPGPYTTYPLGQKVSVRPGDEFYLEFWVWRTGNQHDIRLNIPGFDAAGNATYYDLAATAPPGTDSAWQKFSATVTIPAGNTAWVTPQLKQTHSAAASGGAYIWRPVVRRKATGELIVDGTIKTNHMVADSISGDRIATNTLNADRIVTNSITADQIAANAIQASNIAVGDFTNLITESNQWSNHASAIVVGGVDATGPFVTIQHAGSGNGYARPNNYDIPCVAGDEFFYSYWVYVNYYGFTGSFRPYVQWLNGNKGYLNQTTGAALAQGNGYTTLSGTLVAPSGAKYMRVLPYMEPGGKCAIRDWSIRRRNGGNLIVDGAIDGKTITGATVQGGLFQTSSSTTYSRVEISQHTITGATTGSSVRFSNPFNANGGSAYIQMESLTSTAGELAMSSPSWAGVNRAILTAYNSTGGACQIGLKADDIYVGRSAPWAGRLYVRDLEGSGTVPVNVNASGRLVRGTSSRRYKQNIQPMQLDRSAVLRLASVTYERKPDLADERMDPTRYPGFIAEEAHDLGLTQFVIYNDQGQPDGFRYAEFTAALLEVDRDQQQQIEEAHARIAALEAAISGT